MGAPQYEQAGADIGGSGTTNTIPRWTGPSTLGDSGLIDNGTAIYTTTRNFGIGTASPGALLDVNTGTAAGSYVTSTRLSQTGTAANSGQRILFHNSAQAWDQGAIGSLREGANNNFALTFFTSSAGTNAERARIDSAGRLLVGLTASNQNSAQLQVSADASGALGGEIVVRNGAADAASNTARVTFKISANYGQAVDSCRIDAYRSTAGANLAGLKFWTYGGAGIATALTIDETQNVILGSTTSATIQAAGTSQGLKLQGTGGTNNTDPNVLDCYADGGTANSGGVTWTPELRFGGATTGITYTTRVGRYTRVGNTVMAHCYILLSSKGTATGAVTIGGLPTSSGLANLYAAASIGYLSLITSTGQITGIIAPSGSEVSFYQTPTTGVTAVLSDVNFANGSALVFSIVYSVN